MKPPESEMETSSTVSEHQTTTLEGAKEGLIPFKPCDLKLARCVVCAKVNNLGPLKPTIIPMLRRQNRSFHWQETRQNYICLDCMLAVSLLEERLLMSSNSKFRCDFKSKTDGSTDLETETIESTSTQTTTTTELQKNQVPPPTRIEDKIVDDFVWIKKFPCPLNDCDYSSDKINVASKHCALVHNLHPWYYCKKCNQRFMCQDYLERHMRTQQIFDTSQTVCYKCGREFSSIYTLNQHFENHARSRNYSCTLCHTSFLKESLLKEHLKSDYHLNKVRNKKSRVKVKYFKEKYERKTKSNRFKVHIKILDIHNEQSRYPDKYWYFMWQLGQVEADRNCKKVLHVKSYPIDLS